MMTRIILLSRSAVEQMKITELEIKNFTVFEDARFEFSPGLNVIIGENGTGKSHLLKLMYAVLKGSARSGASSGDLADALVSSQHGVLEKLRAVFMPESGRLERLVRQGAKDGASIRLATDNAASEISIRPAKERGSSALYGFEGSPQFDLGAPCVFLPPADALALYEGFIGSYAKRALSLDETYNDLCVALNANLLRQEPEWAVEILRRVEKLIGGKVMLKGERFYVGKHEAHLVAAGHRKLAEIVRLIANGGITPETVLFWDEPEAGLNPQLISLVAELAILFAKAGVQVFIATHDFILSSRLSLIAEHKTEAGVEAQPRFIGLRRKRPTAPVDVEWADTVVDLEYDPILAASIAHYDLEQRMFMEAGQGACT